MTALIVQPKFETLTTRLNSKGEECYDEHTIAEALGLQFSDLRKITDRLQKANDIDGQDFICTVKAGFTTKEVESRMYNLDDTKLIVTQSGGKHAVAFCRYLIQRDKKATSFDALLNDPDNAIKVFQELANQKRKAQELEARIPQLESETQKAKRRGFSAMGTAGALTVEANKLRQENERLQLQSSSLLTEIGKLGVAHHDFIAQLKETYGVEIEQLKFSNKAFIETLAHVSEQYPWLPKTIKEAKEQLSGSRRLDWGNRGSLYVKWAIAATDKQEITQERLKQECLSKNFITEGDLLRKLKEVADKRRAS